MCHVTARVCRGDSQQPLDPQLQATLVALETSLKRAVLQHKSINAAANGKSGYLRDSA